MSFKALRNNIDILVIEIGEQIPFKQVHHAKVLSEYCTYNLCDQTCALAWSGVCLFDMLAVTVTTQSFVEIGSGKYSYVNSLILSHFHCVTKSSSLSLSLSLSLSSSVSRRAGLLWFSVACFWCQMFGDVSP